MSFKIITLGCKVNAYESEFMTEKLKEAGYIYDTKTPDIIIINTCSVTNNADIKSLKTVRRARRENNKAILVVVGCSSQNNQEKYKDLGIDILLGNKEKSKIVEVLNKYIETKEKYTYFTNNRNLDFEDMQVSKFTSHTRAFVKIQDGCNNFCSYCIIPFTRGAQRCKDFDRAIAEIKELVKNGHQEIVLTGIHTGSYNSNGKDLTDLIHEISKIDNLKRIRISSIEITELDNKFMEELKVNPKICNHLHIPLQSGSDHILKIMNRKYDKDYFTKKIKELRSIRPDISITTDAIVGHPYETDEDFLEYIDYVLQIEFSKIHVFPFSKRDGTKASLMPEVDERIKRERTNKLLDISLELENKYYHKFLNKEVEILTEEIKDNYIIGHTSNYLKVYIENNNYKLNNFYKCKIIEIKDNNIYGIII